MAETAAGKVVLGIIEREGKFLLIRRKKPHLSLEWAFPGGIIKAGETDEEAVVREVKEEVGLDVEVVGPKILERKHPNTLVQIAYFHCRLLGEQTPFIGEEYEIAQIEWVGAREVLERFTSDVDPVIREFVLSFVNNNGKER